MTLSTCPRCGAEYYSSNRYDHNGIHGFGPVTRAHTEDPPPPLEPENGCPIPWCETILDHYHDAEGYVRYQPAR